MSEQFLLSKSTVLSRSRCKLHTTLQKYCIHKLKTAVFESRHRLKIHTWGSSITQILNRDTDLSLFIWQNTEKLRTNPKNSIITRKFSISVIYIVRKEKIPYR